VRALNSILSLTAVMKSDYLRAISSRIDSLWVPDDFNAMVARAVATPDNLGMARLVPNVGAYLEPWTILGHLAARNRLGRLRLGIGVTDAGRRNPAVTAQAAATVHLLTRGRAILGIDAGEREGNEPYGLDWRRPVARLEEAPATIWALWNSRGERVTRDSHHFSLRDETFNRIAGDGRRSGWRRTDPGSWVSPAATATRGLPASRRLRTITPTAYRWYAPWRAMPAATR
jgi:phthiodiolone/phenolphthiodiolone dimycocerosates ketoreductase